MSASAYQTNAKPRSRRGSHGEAAEKNRSRASSSASLKLSKTLSRTLDEVAVPRNSRPSSPAIYIHRRKTVDCKPFDQPTASARHSTSSVASSRTARSKYEDERTRPPGSAAKMKPQVVQSFQEGQGLPNSPMAHEDLVTQSVSTAALEANAMEPQGTGTTSMQPLRETSSSRLPGYMQPTVEEVDETLDLPASSVPPEMIMHSSPPATPAAQSAPVTKDEAGEDSAHPTLAASPSAFPEPPIVHNAIDSAASPGNPLPAPRPKASVTFIQPPLVQQLPEPGEAEAPVPVMPSPSSGAEPTTLYDMPPKPRSPVFSPTQSPMLPHVGSPPPQHVLYPFPYPLPFMGSPQFHPAVYPPNFASPNAPFISGEGMPRSGSAGAEDERAKLLEKVSAVLPDIDRLLHYYRETQGLLSEKDYLVRRAESQHEEELSRLRIELSASKEEFERIIGDQATENVKLKGEIMERNEKVAALEDASRDLSSVREQLVNLRQEHESLKKNVEKGEQLNEQLTVEKKALEEMVGSLREKAVEERALHERTLAELKVAHEQQLAEKDQEHIKALADNKGGLSKVQLDLAGVITKHNQQRRELESARALISEHELSLASKAKELADALQRHQDESQAKDRAAKEKEEQHKHEIAKLSAEISELEKKHQEEVRLLRDSHGKEVETIQKEAEGRLADAETEYTRLKAQLQDELNTARSEKEAVKTDLAKEREALEGLKVELDNSRKAHEVLAEQHDMTRKHHAELADSMRSLKDKQAEWHRESERMDRLLHGFGQLVSNKTTGTSDQFYIDAFNQLAVLVEEISTWVFHDNPSSVACHRQMDQKLDFRDMSEDANVARAIRSLMIQNKIWSIIHRRIFAPFVLTSAYGSEDEEEMDKKLSILSEGIRRKSLRRDAIWRTITRRAIYASAAGRKAARVVATKLSWEIMATVWVSTGWNDRQALHRAVRSVAKLAVETWRRVGLEWDLIHSSMPSTPESGMMSSDVMLWVRPRIVRETLGFTGASQSAGDAGIGSHHAPIMASRVLLQGAVGRVSGLSVGTSKAGGTV